MTGVASQPSFLGISDDCESIMLISMATKRFHHLGQEWEAVGTDTGHGVGFGYLPSVDRWGVILRSVSNPQQDDYRYRGTM